MFSRNRSTKIRIWTGLIAMLMMLTMASAAQASEWEANHQTLTELGQSAESITGVSEGIEITSRVLGEPTRISCADSSKGSIVTGGKAHFSMSLTGCAVLEPVGCVITSPVKIEAESEFVKVGAVTYDKLTIVGAAPKVPIVDCAIESNPKLSGTFAALGDQSETQQASQTLVYSNAASAATGSKLLLSKEVASLSGAEGQQLAGARAGRPWNANLLANPAAPYNWLVGGAGLVGATGVESTGGPFVFKWSSLGQSIEVSCGGTVGVNEVIRGGGSGEGKLRFTECRVVSGPCTVPSIITTEQLQGSLTAANGYMYEKFANSSGGPLWLMRLTGCSMEGAYPVQGTFAGKLSKSASESAVQPLAVSAGPNRQVGGGMSILSSAFEVTGTLQRTVVGGRVWGAS